MEKRRITIFRHAFCHFHSSGFHYRARNNRQDLIIGQFHLNLERVEEFARELANPRGLIRREEGEGEELKIFRVSIPW